MKVLIPLAGFGSRLRPQTYSRPKPLINIAGKPVLGHLLDKLQGLPIDEYIFITGYLGDQIEAFVKANYGGTPSRYYEQTVLNGQSPAIYLAKEAIEGPLLIVFVDTIFQTDLSFLATTEADGVAFVKEVDDPRRFGVAATDEDGMVQQFVEKPESMENKLAVIGMYYIKESANLLRAIEKQMSDDIQTKGEYYLADALQLMVNAGTGFKVEEVDAWLDAGTYDAVIETNELLLNSGSDNSAEVNAEGYTIVPPVNIHPTARIKASVIGPNATIAANCVVENCIIRNSIVDSDTTVKNMLLKDSLVGQKVTLKGKFRKLNVGDTSIIQGG